MTDSFSLPSGWRAFVQITGALAIIACLIAIGGWFSLGSMHHDLSRLERALFAITFGTLFQVLAAVFAELGFIAWAYKSHRNLIPLRAESVIFAPVFIAIALIIPIVNLFLALPILLEIWNGSDPARIPNQRSLLRRRPATSVFVWFGCVLLEVTVLLVAALSYFQRFMSGDASRELIQVSMILEVLWIVHTGAMLFIVTDITSMQAWRYDTLHQQVVESESSVPWLSMRWGIAAHLMTWGALLAVYFLFSESLFIIDAKDKGLPLFVSRTIDGFKFFRSYWPLVVALIFVDFALLFIHDSMPTLGPLWRIGFPVAAAVLFTALCLTLVMAFDGHHIVFGW